MSMAMHDALFAATETTGGRIRGLINAGVRIFRGIPSGADTGGAHRFQPPRAHAGWTGVRDCFGPGPMAPQIPSPLNNIYAQLIQFESTLADGGMSEDCLSLNMWTKGVRDRGNRPVVVNLHGGGFALGSGNAAMYDGAQMAFDHDVVVVSVNHRLASFGYLGLRALGLDERFDAAGHCGLLDLALALEWVQRNAESFGGDPTRVTIIGQSGGGWKVGALMATPAAAGLFHRAVIQSGSWLRFQTEEQGAMLAEMWLARLGVAKTNPQALFDLDFTHILAAQTEVGPLGFMPVLHPTGLPAHPFDGTAPAQSRDVALIVATTLDDAGLFYEDFDLTEEGLHGWAEARFGGEGAALVALYRAQYPAKSPYLLHAQMVTDAGFRRFAWAQASAEAAQNGAPVWMYRWDWPSPAWDGALARCMPSMFRPALAMCVTACWAPAWQPGGGCPACCQKAWRASPRRAARWAAPSRIGRAFRRRPPPACCWGRKSP